MVIVLTLFFTKEGAVFTSHLIQRLRVAQRIAVLTGAGISAESGVPTFRGEEGLWKKFKPEELANFDAFIQNPKLVWEWYNWRKKLISDVEPNPGHLALTEIEKKVSHFWLITQNVDGLHQKAGSQTVLELHGNIMRNRCNECGQLIDQLELQTEESLPYCLCGGLIRPDVVWFGEMLPQNVIIEAIRAAEISDVFLSIGTSAIVHPAASLPLTAKNAGSFVIEINLDPTPISSLVDEFISGKSGEVLPLLVKAVWDT
jgi:NAD-dependent deacetylase